MEPVWEKGTMAEDFDLLHQSKTKIKQVGGDFSGDSSGPKKWQEGRSEGQKWKKWKKGIGGK